MLPTEDNFSNMRIANKRHDMTKNTEIKTTFAPKHLIGAHKSAIETPALLLYVDTLQRNIDKMASFFADKPCKPRPHIKTHKLPAIARKQLEAGAIGVTCATVTEAETFAAAGLKDILIANEIVENSKIERLARLAADCNLIVAVDDFRIAVALSAAAKRRGTRPGLLLDINVGLNRCGVQPGAPAVEPAARIAALNSIEFRGIMGYEGSFLDCPPDDRIRLCRESDRLLVETAELLRKNGIPVEIVSAGGVHTFEITGTHPGITEIQVGSYATMDGRNESLGLPFDAAVTVLTTIVSRPEPTRAITDAGMKALSVDAGLSLPREKGVTLLKLNEEHGHLRVDDPAKSLPVGSKIEIVPWHGCTTIPLYDRYHFIRDDRVVDIVPFNPHH